MLIFVNEVEDDSDTKEKFANKAMKQIISYYDTNGYYPKSLDEIPVYSDQKFVTYVQDNTFEYSSYEGNIPKFFFSWRGGAMNWTAYRCTNDKSDIPPKHDGIIRTYKISGGTVCTVTDLH